MTSLEVVPLTGLPLIGAGDDLTELIASAFRLNGVLPRAGDVLVVAQKIVSKAEGRPSTSRRSNPPHGLSHLRRMSARTRGSWRSFYRSRFVWCGRAAAC